MPASSARAVVVYNLGRIGLFVGCALLGYLAGMRGLPLLVAALVVSGLLSWFLLARQRVAMAQVVAGAAARGRSRLERGAEAEDALLDAEAEASSHETTRPGG